MASKQKYVLQICHGYDGPFLDCARQYQSLFDDTQYKVITVFLTGAPSQKAHDYLSSEEVFFFDYPNAHLKGLKWGIIKKIKLLHAKYQFITCIAHRTKPTYVALMATDIPIFSVHHAFGDFDRLGRRLFVSLFKKRLTILAVSNSVRDEIRSRLKWSNTKICTLYNCINIKAVRAKLLPRNEAREKLGLPEKGWLIGHVGRLHPDKDQVTLIHGFKQALPALPKNCMLVIIGKGRLEIALKELTISLGIQNRVLFLGAVNEAKYYFKAFDIFALSSDHEPFGMVILEAMVAGIQVISSNCGGAPEILKDQGILFEFKNSNELADSFKLAYTQYQSEPSRNYDLVLSNKFSDQSSKNRFWQLPSVIESLPIKK